MASTLEVRLLHVAADLPHTPRLLAIIGEDYFTHQVGGGYDFRADLGRNCGKGCSQVWWQEQGNYSTNVFSRVAVDIVESHDTSNPLFLYLPYQVQQQQQQHSFASRCLQLTLHSPWLVASPGRSFTRRGASTILGYASLAVSHLASTLTTGLRVCSQTPTRASLTMKDAAHSLAC